MKRAVRLPGAASRRRWYWGSIFADMLVVLLKPFPPLEKGAVSVPEGYRLCPGCGDLKARSCFWRGRARCKSCLGSSNRQAYVRRLGKANRKPVKRSKYEHEDTGA